MKQDRRVQYTKRALKESLMELLHEKAIEKITVKELCERADVNRSTFYVYYGSPKELLDSIIDEMYAEMAAKPRDFENLHEFQKGVCESLMAYRELMLVMLGSSDLIGMLFRLVGIWEDQFRAAMREAGLEGERCELVYNYISAGTCFAIGTWVTGGGMGLTADEMAAELEQLILHGIGSYFTEN